MYHNLSIFLLLSSQALVSQVTQSGVVADAIRVDGFDSLPTFVAVGTDTTNGVRAVSTDAHAEFDYDVVEVGGAPVRFDLYQRVHTTAVGATPPNPNESNSSGWIDVALTAPVPTLVELDVESTIMNLGAFVYGYFWVSIDGVVQHADDEGGFNQPVVTTLQVVVGPTPTVMTIAASLTSVAFATVGFGGTGTLDAEIDLTVLGLAFDGCVGADQPVLTGTASASSSFTFSCPTMQQACTGPRLMFFGQRTAVFELPPGLGCGICTFAINPSWGSVVDQLSTSPGVPVGLELWVQCGCVATNGGGLCVDLSDSLGVVIAP